MALVYTLLFTTLVIAATPSSTACPVSCNCTTSDLKVSVSCKGEGLTAIPSKLPENTTTVDLRDNPVKCDCEFYRYWKTLKEKGIVIQGQCSDTSADLSGSSFKDLKDNSFACDGLSIGSQKYSSFSTATASSTAAVNVRPSSSVISEKNPSFVSKHVAVPAVTSSQAAQVVTSSQDAPVLTSSHAVLVVMSPEAVPVVTSSQAVPVVASSQAAPVVKSPQAVPVVTSSQAAPVVTSPQAVPVVTSSQAVPVVASSQAAPVVTSPQAVPVVTSSQAVPVVTSPQAVPVVTSSQAVPVVASSQAAPVVTSPQAVPVVTSSQAVPVVTSPQAVPVMTSSQAVPVVTSSQVAPVVTSSQAVPMVTSSQAVRVVTSSVVTAPPLRSTGVEVNVTSVAEVLPTASAAATVPPTRPDGLSIGSQKYSSFSTATASSTAAVNVRPSSSVISEKNPSFVSKHVAVPAVTSSQAAQVVTSSQDAPVLTSSHAVLVVMSPEAVPVVTSSQAVPVVASSQAAPVVKSPQAVPVVTSSQAAPVVTSPQAVPVVTSSQAVPVVASSQAAPVVTSPQAVPVVTSSQAVPVVTSPQAVPVVTSSQAVPVVASSQAAPVVTSPQAVPVVTSSQAVPVVTSPQAVPVMTSSQAVPVVTSSQVAPVVTSSQAVPMVTSSQAVRVVTSSVVTAPPLRSTGVEVNVTSVAEVLPTASAAATVPPTRPGPPVIVAFHEPKTIHLNTMVQVKCVATGNPPPKVHLTFNNRPAESVDGVTVTSTDSETEIKFKAVRNSEIYCEATNELGRDKRKVKISVDQTGAKYLLVKVELPDEVFNENLKNKDSKEFQDLAEEIVSQVRSLLSSIPGFLGASVVRFSSGSVKADILIKTYQDNDDSVENTLKTEISKAKLGTLRVDRYLYTFEQTRACPSVFENVTWNDAAHGESDVQPCPRGAQGFARRNCSAGNWYYPDYTNCKSSDFLRLKNQMNQSMSRDTNKDNTEMNILTGLQNLLNLTTPNEDYAIMAGDLVISTEILELVVGYLTREKQDSAHSKEEVKHIINVASNTLHQNNEQECIVAQKLIQTASRFILALEKYGVQSARVASLGADMYLAIFITDNVVMGAGIADPKTISEDVIFPNYNWPNLAHVKEEWNVTTFVVLGQEMIKPMNDAGIGIRIAGFLYRTLTKILSFESAYSNKGLAFEVNSAVISASMDPKPTSKLNTPVVIASSNLQEVDDDDKPICAYWDFDMNAPHGGWSEEGCNATSFNRRRTTCHCDHMTNFAVLRRKPLPPVIGKLANSVSDFIHCIYIACWIIIAFAAITFLILLILCPWLKPDRTWVMHMCVCASIIVTFVLILLGLASYNDLGLCNLFSFLTHYFFLCAFSWILTESVYMRTWDTDKGSQKKYWIGYFLLGWGLPAIAMVIAWLINKLIHFESYMSCWLSVFNPLVWVFFAPALVFFLVSCLIFVRVWRAITGIPRQGLKTQYHKTRFRVHIRYCIILMIMFIITWLVGVLLLTYYWKALLCILFIICCIITGFMILLFYVIMDRQVRNAFRICCCYCKRGRRGSYWVQGEGEVLKRTEQEEIEYRQQERQRLVSEDTDQDIEMNGVHEEPLLIHEARPVLMYQAPRPLESSSESFDPLYERVNNSAAVEEQPDSSTEEEKPEPVYAQVVKPKRLRHPESDSDDDDDDDEFLTPEEREARAMRGLTREQVIRMAKKSDASKRVLKTYESPSGSKEQLGGPVYLLNQQEMDEELKQFRSFFAHGKEPLSSEPTTSTPKSQGGSSTPSGTFKRETSTEVHRSDYQRVESTSSSITKRTLSGESQRSVTSVSWKEESTVEKMHIKLPGVLDETAIDSSLQELDRMDSDAESDTSSKPTAVSDDDLRASLFKYFTSTHQKEEQGDVDWRELLDALKE